MFKGGNQSYPGDKEEWRFANKPYKKSPLPVVDYDLPSLYEEMKIKGAWDAWPVVFRPF